MPKPAFKRSRTNILAARKLEREQKLDEALSREPLLRRLEVP